MTFDENYAENVSSICHASHRELCHSEGEECPDYNFFMLPMFFVADWENNEGSVELFCLKFEFYFFEIKPIRL